MSKQYVAVSEKCSECGAEKMVNDTEHYDIYQCGTKVGKRSDGLVESKQCLRLQRDQTKEQLAQRTEELEEAQEEEKKASLIVAKATRLMDRWMVRAEQAEAQLAAEKAKVEAARVRELEKALLEVKRCDHIERAQYIARAALEGEGDETV